MQNMIKITFTYSFYSENVAARECKVTEVAHMVFLLYYAGSY